MYEILQKFWHLVLTGLIFTMLSIGFARGLLIIGTWMILLVPPLCAVCELTRFCLYCFL